MGFFRTILRRSFYSASALSTLLLLAVLILWPVSHYRQLYAYYKTAGGEGFYLGADSGRAELVTLSGFVPRPGWHVATLPPQWSHWSYRSWNTPDPDFGSRFAAAPTFLGVCWYHVLLPTIGGISQGVYVPFSYLTVLLAILPLLACRALRRGRAARVGMCPTCSYDLRAHAAGTRCPECGTMVASHR